MRRVVNYTEGVNQVVWLNGNIAAQFFCICGIESHSVFQSINTHTLACNLEGSHGKIDGGHQGTVPRKTDGVRTNPAPHFEDFFFAPAREFGESWDVGSTKYFRASTS